MNETGLYEEKKRGTSSYPMDFYHWIDDRTPHYQMPFHWHFENELIYVREGSFLLNIDGSPSTLQAGDCAFIGEEAIHGGAPQGCCYDCVVFDLYALMNNTAIFASGAAVFSSDPRSCTAIFKKDSIGAGLITAIFESDEKKQAGYEWNVLGFLWQLMGHMIASNTDIPHPPRKAKQFKKVLRLIRDHYAEPITLEMLAKEAGMVSHYFCRAFSAMTGKTPIAYLNYYRIEQAGERLLLSEERITDIAFACGFNDAGYFTKAFSRQKGLSPSQYRKQYKK